MSPNQPFGQALGDFVENIADRRRKLTQERVDSVLPDGHVVIRGTILPVTGRVPIVAGETVAVAWRENRMDVVMLNQGRRSGGAALLIEGGAGCVEELFVYTGGTDQEDGIWFRNATQFIRLFGFPEDIRPPGGLSSVPSVTWGHFSADHFVLEGVVVIASVQHRYIDVYKLNRPTSNEPFPDGFSIKASRVQLHDLTTDARSYGSLTVGMDSIPAIAPVSTPLTVLAECLLTMAGAGVASSYPTNTLVVAPNVKIQVSPAYQGVLTNGDVVLALNLTSSMTNTFGAVVMNDPTASPIPNVAFYDANTVTLAIDLGTVIVNLTAGTVLLTRARGSYVIPIDIFVRQPILTGVGGTTTDVTTQDWHTAGNLTLTVSPGVDVAQSGQVTVLSASVSNDTVTLHSYTLVGPVRPETHAVAAATGGPGAVQIGVSVVGSNYTQLWPALTFSIVGDFAQIVGTSQGGNAQVLLWRPFFQAHRYRLFWAQRGDVVPGTPEPRFFMVDLQAGQTTTIEANSLVVGGKSFMALEAGLIYVYPFEANTPNLSQPRQFFADPAKFATTYPLGPTVNPNVSGLGSIAKLKTQAKVLRPKALSLPDLVSKGSASTAVHVLDSRTLLSFFKKGPLA